MHFTENQIVEDDPLKIIRLFAIDSFNTIFGKLLLAIIFIIFLSATLLQTYYICFDFNGDVFLKQAPVYFTQIYMLVCISFILYYNIILYDLRRVSPKWQFSVAKSIMKKTFCDECFYLTLFTLILLSLTVGGSIIFIIPTEQEHEIFFLYDWMGNHFVEGKSAVIILIKFSLIFLALILQIPYCQIAYSFQQQNFRFYSLIDHLESVNADFEDVSPSDLLFNQIYHQSIQERLEYCIKRHIELLNLFRESLKQSEVIIFLFSVAGALLLISVLLFILLVGGMPSLIYIKMVYFCIVCLITGGGYFVSGQCTEDSYGEIYKTLCKTSWYYWNNSNQKYYLIFMMVASKPLKIKFSSNIVFNYDLGLKIVRAAYSTCCVMYRKTHNIQ
ncbi:hypothetical protein Zmor_026813 [Zophobas morio]|uniref:Odorant receptor n=1 Tax=Zophobas morio TaxID=2755281 RepID=A0AA38HWB2_9CUCU|nr:hypothetical protein Zmor_026813 [Zophobas morio]